MVVWDAQGKTKHLEDALGHVEINLDGIQHDQDAVAGKGIYIKMNLEDYDGPPRWYVDDIVTEEEAVNGGGEGMLSSVMHWFFPGKLYMKLTHHVGVADELLVAEKGSKGSREKD